MQENNTQRISGANSLSIITAILKRWLLIVLVTIFCALVGLCYSLAFVKPTYTAKCSVILRLSVGDLQANTVTTNVALAKIYLPDVIEFVSSPAVINKANEIIGTDNTVKASRVGVQYSNKDLKSLIFSITYTDASIVEAEKKLQTLIDSVMIVDEQLGVIESEEFALIPVQNEFGISINNNFSTYIIFGVAAGLLISVVIAIIMYMFDNTVVDKNEFEELTGIDVLANIRKEK